MEDYKSHGAPREGVAQALQARQNDQEMEVVLAAGVGNGSTGVSEGEGALVFVDSLQPWGPGSSVILTTAPLPRLRHDTGTSSSTHSGSHRPWSPFVPMSTTR